MARPEVILFTSVEEEADRVLVYNADVYLFTINIAWFIVHRLQWALHETKERKSPVHHDIL